MWFDPERNAPFNWRWFFTQPDDENQLLSLIMKKAEIETGVPTSLVLNRQTDTFELRENPRRPCKFQFVETLWQPELESILRARERLSAGNANDLSSYLQNMRVEE